LLRLESEVKTKFNDFYNLKVLIFIKGIFLSFDQG